jgi:tetratricopeptide (TPR) repeat protein
MNRISLIFALALVWRLGCSGALPAAAQVSQSQSAARHPIAKSQQEYDDYRLAAAATNGPALEKAAGAFAQKYPQSELRRYLFSKALRQYQRENNASGMLGMGEQVLALDPNDSLALVLTATVLADGMIAGDPDWETKIREITSNSARAIQAAEAGSSAPADASFQQAALYRSTLQSMAYSALGIMKLKTGDDGGAEKDLQAAVHLAKIHPDPYIWYHLALAQDHRKRYPAALHSVEQALQLASANPQLQRLAETEHERLNRLTGRAKDAPQSGGNESPH